MKEGFFYKLFRSLKCVFLGVWLLLCLSLSACAEFIPLPDETLDAIDKYEKKRAETKQAHTHVQYCDNDVLKLTFSGRGELVTREIYVPRKSVALFRNRDNLNTYPLGVLLYKRCILEGPVENCDKREDRIGVNTTILDSTEDIFDSWTKRLGLELYSQEKNGLYKLRVSESFRDKPHMKLKKDYEVYTNFSPFLTDGVISFPTLLIRYRDHKYMRPDKRKCEWRIVTDEAIRTSRASHCDDLDDWETYVSEFDLISDKISKEGEFARDCKN